MNPEWIKEIKIEDLPPSWREVAEVIGIESTLKLSEYFGGQTIYFIQTNTLLAKKKEEYIRKNFNGINHRELAQATGYSMQWIYKILRDGKTTP